MPASRKDSKVVVVIPTKNEGRTIQEIIRGVRPYGDNLLVVDGHSTDDTCKLAEEMGVRVILDNKRGKGDGLRKAIETVEKCIDRGELNEKTIDDAYARVQHLKRGLTP